MASRSTSTYHDLEVSVDLPKNSTRAKATVHYVEAGDPTKSKILLLHGFPSSSHQYRDFIPMLSDSYYVLAPDYPGFGLTRVSDNFVHTFENITMVIAAWIQELKIDKAAIFIQDYGAPVGLRLAITNALQVTAIITQNGNAYAEGLGTAVWKPLGALHESNAPEMRKLIAERKLTLEGCKQSYVAGTPEKDLHLIDPQTWTFDYLQNIAGHVNTERQLDMLYDYRTNIELYPAFQKYFQDSKVPILAAWGKGDPSFIWPGAEAFRKDAPDVEIHLLDAGHFALETARWEIARLTKDFLARKISKTA